MKIKIVVITGPTATGKSDFAVEYALKHNGEVISADSRQVYKGMDIGTGKITIEEMKGVPHHLLDVADPSEQFNVGQYKKLAQEAIEDISSRGKLPIICGGTGFYIDAVVNNISYPDVPHDKELREGLEKMTTEELFTKLATLDKEFAISLNNSEINNRQRLVRLIEIATALGNIPKVTKNQSDYDVTWIGLNYPYEKLKERIHIRLLKRVDAGMIEEIERLHKEGLSWEKLDGFGLEYRYISRFLREMITKEEMLKLLEIEICHYAKRQMVWFKRNKEIEWVNKN
jgi:tRNA dimethylallyltransferase